MTQVWHISPRCTLTLDVPRVMAVVNLTPDSFFVRSRGSTPEAALEAVFRAVGDGADVLDLGGESTRPGAGRVSATEQIDRIVPILRAVRAAGGKMATIPISIDTTLSRVARTCLAEGADCINDVSAGTEDPEMFAAIAESGCGVILMHRLHDPTRDSYSDRYTAPPHYDDVVKEVAAFLTLRVQAAQSAGIGQAGILVDPGLGFGKTVAQNLELIRHTAALSSMGCPVLSALSRKSFVGRLSFGHDSTPDERLPGTLALSVLHYLAGARIFRVHDVRELIQALRATAALYPLP